MLPLLFGDRFVGRIEPRVERRERTVRIERLHWEDGFDPLGEPGFVGAFADALAAYRSFAGADRVTLPADRASRALARAVAGVDGSALGASRRRARRAVGARGATRDGADGRASSGDAPGGPSPGGGLRA